MADMCDRCVECAQLLRMQLAEGDKYPLHTLHETAAQLLASRCRICRIFGRSIPTNLEPPIDVSLVARPGNHVAIHFDPIGQKLSGPRDVYLTYSDKPFDPESSRSWNASDEIGPAEVSRISKWLEECRQHHRKCIPTHQNGTLRGLRVIDCIGRCVVTAPAACSYVALSYVWGESLGYEQLFSNVETNNLPQTIQDSIEVTWKLGFRYLWVDRYVCIQHSPKSPALLIRCLVYRSARCSDKT
jgi:hypothetical protein